MFVDPNLLRTGGNDSRRAGDHAQEGADRLARGPLSSGMFGEFGAAEAFHEAVSSAHAQHVTNLQASHQALTAVGANAHRAAAGFTDMDRSNAADMRAVRPSSVRTEDGLPQSPAPKDPVPQPHPDNRCDPKEQQNLDDAKTVADLEGQVSALEERIDWHNRHPPNPHTPANSPVSINYNEEAIEFNKKLGELLYELGKYGCDIQAAPAPASPSS